MKIKKSLSNVIVHTVLAILAVIWVLPIVWVVLISFRAEKGAYTSTFLPQSYTLSNYIRLFTETDTFNFPLWFGNTLVVAIFSCIISTFYVLSVSYVMSRLRFKLRKKFMNIALILGMFPGFMAMIAVYYILKGVGLTTGALKLVSLVLVYSGGAGLTFYVAKGFFDTIPKAIDEAAIIDGCSKWQVYTKIVLPLLKPTTVTVAVLNSIWIWNDFLLPFLTINGKLNTIPLAMNNFFGAFSKQWELAMAALILAIIPIVIFYFFVQKQIIAGIVQGSIK